jgi:hypothetical protein
MSQTLRTNEPKKKKEEEKGRHRGESRSCHFTFTIVFLFFPFSFLPLLMLCLDLLVDHFLFFRYSCLSFLPSPRDARVFCWDLLVDHFLFFQMFLPFFSSFSFLTSVMLAPLLRLDLLVDHFLFLKYCYLNILNNFDSLPRGFIWHIPTMSFSDFFPFGSFLLFLLQRLPFFSFFVLDLVPR